MKLSREQINKSEISSFINGVSGSLGSLIPSVFFYPYDSLSNKKYETLCFILIFSINKIFF